MGPLPIDAHVGRVREALASSRAAVLVAPPGSGKTTRVPPALAADGPVFLLQPRRLAARSIARRIADEQGWTLGDTVGWQVRFERCYGKTTRLLVATEGILTRRLQSDPLLDGFRTIVLDEFHERSVHADLALAFAREAWRARDDLRLLVMSATLDAGAVSRFLDDCPVIDVPGRPHSIEVRYEPGRLLADAVRAALASPGGHVLCFLPGAPEIRRAQAELGEVAGASVLPLHGTLSAEEQDRALAESAERKVVLATNVAETSLTVAGVTDVIDTGQHKVLRYDASRGLDRLERERIPADSAEQRKGRAGRTGPGRVVRLWDARDRLRAHGEPEIERVDLAGPALDVLAWGADPSTFEWFETPPVERLESAMALLARLGALSGRRLTPDGRAMHRLPLHPRLARVFLSAGGGARAAAACAVLGEGWRPPFTGEAPTTESDVLSAADRLREAPPAVRAAARDLEGARDADASGRRQGAEAPGARARRGSTDAKTADPSEPGRRGLLGMTVLRALLAGFPDRVARRRERGSSRLVLGSGTGALLGRESGVRDGELLVALEVTAGAAGAAGEPIVRLASRVEREWLVGVRTEVVHRFDDASGSVRAFARDWYDRLLLGERPVPPDLDLAAPLLAEALARRGLGDAAERLRRRLRVAGLPDDFRRAALEACRGRVTLPSLDEPSLWLDPGSRRQVDRLAPERLGLPSGRSVALDYREDGTVAAAVKLQELFGLAETPQVGLRQEPVVFELLAPNGRPVQTTRDLRSFWERTYPEVRRELRGRYPRHPWPEDPWTAEPTHRAKKRGR
ncbi:MAG TPA: ATP-dependent helicase HrpB [Vicinamibacteria bacterium]|nr:ATP-dependent helicase HrpB [Vicinamibacteria bacterium]